MKYTICHFEHSLVPFRLFWFCTNSEPYTPTRPKNDSPEKKSRPSTNKNRCPALPRASLSPLLGQLCPRTVNSAGTPGHQTPSGRPTTEKTTHLSPPSFAAPRPPETAFTACTKRPRTFYTTFRSAHFAPRFSSIAPRSPPGNRATPAHETLLKPPKARKRLPKADQGSQPFLASTI